MSTSVLKLLGMLVAARKRHEEVPPTVGLAFTSEGLILQAWDLSVSIAHVFGDLDLCALQAMS